MFIRFMGLMVVFTTLTAVGVAIAGYFPMKRIEGIPGVMAMIAGCGISWMASCAGAIPVALAASRNSMSGSATAILASTAVRFVTALALVAPLALSGLVERTPMVMWVGISYLVLLLVDTLVSIRVLRMASHRAN